MFSAILVNILNIIFNYILVFGKLGIPAMGVAGSGLGASIATIFDAAYYFIVTSHKSFRNTFKLYHRFGFNPETIKSIFRLSLPVSFQNVFILIGFLTFISIIGLIGTLEQAASQAVISSLFLSFLPTYGFGIAAQTLVGNHVGSGKIIQAKLYGFETAKIASYYTVFLGIAFISFPSFILNIITTNVEIINEAIPILRLAGFAQIFYATGVVLANGLQAMGKTKFVMYSEVLTNLVLFAGLSYLAGIIFDGGLLLAWAGLPVYVISYSAIILIKFRSINSVNLSVNNT